MIPIKVIERFRAGSPIELFGDLYEVLKMILTERVPPHGPMEIELDLRRIVAPSPDVEPIVFEYGHAVFQDDVHIVIYQCFREIPWTKLFLMLYEEPS